MKLIIDIEKDYYEIIKHEVEHGHDFKPYILIAHGIPLDDIRKEINDLPKTYPFINHIDTYVKTDDVIRIIDRHIKERSNDAISERASK